MLDVQRYRGETFRMEVAYARKVMWCHLLTGTVVITLLLFHEQFWWFGGTLGWFAATVMAMLGYMSQVPLCRWVLGGLFLIACSTGVYFTTEVYPSLISPKAPILPQNFIPIWAGMANLVYACSAALVFFSSKIRRAGSVGFTLW